MADERVSLADRIDSQHTAVLIIDVQPLFTGMTLFPPVNEVLPRIRRFIDAARDAEVLRVFIRVVIPDARWTDVWDQHYAGRSRPGEWTLKDALAPGSPLNEFAPGFEPEPGDEIVIKQRYSAFVDTDLAAILRARKIHTVILVGLTTDVCVTTTARDAFHHEFHTVTVSDCTAERTLERHESGLATLAANFGRVQTSDEIIAVWQEQLTPIA